LPFFLYIGITMSAIDTAAKALVPADIILKIHVSSQCELLLKSVAYVYILWSWSFSQIIKQTWPKSRGDEISRSWWSAGIHGLALPLWQCNMVCFHPSRLLEGFSHPKLPAILNSKLTIQNNPRGDAIYYRPFVSPS
jgi:hypothetical protein